MWISPFTRESPGKSFPFASSCLRDLPPLATIERPLPCPKRRSTRPDSSALRRFGSRRSPCNDRGRRERRGPDSPAKRNEGLPGSPPCNSLPRRDSLLACEAPGTLVEARVLIEQGRGHTDTMRPHSSAGCRPPAPEVILSRTPVPAGPPGPAGSAPAPGTMLNRRPTPTTRRSRPIRLPHDRMSSINR